MSHTHTFRHAGSYKKRITLTFVKPRGGEGQNGRLKCPMGFLVFFLSCAFVSGENAYLTTSGNHRNTPQSSLTTPSTAIKAHIMELEGSSYSLRSLFHLPGAIKVRSPACILCVFCPFSNALQLFCVPMFC